MQRAEANLDKFWQKVDSILVNKHGISQHAAIRHLLTNDRIMYRPPDSIEPVKDEPVSKAKDLYLPLS